MIREMGYVNGIENYSRYFDGRQPGEPPYTLVDYFRHQYHDNFLAVIDESHMTVPQLRGMFQGDSSRKKTLIDFGFRLPSALDNRPLRFEELLPKLPATLYVSATPEQWEINQSHQRVAEQLIRPTGLVDPEVEVRPSEGQIPDLVREIVSRKAKGERVLVTTLTKKMSEELSRYLSDPAKTQAELLVNYLHADISTLDRTDILADLRSGRQDVIVGVNLLREGLDLPEVSLVVILDADKQGFLRSKTSLIQTMGRAARNVGGKVILYADEMSLAMKQALSEVNRRRQTQLEYNRQQGIIPKTIVKPIRDRLVEKTEKEEISTLDEESLTPGEAKRILPKLNRQMRALAKNLDFEQAAKIRDKIERIKKHFDLA
jgi:excinuclease ABC subunit B